MQKNILKYLIVIAGFYFLTFGVVLFVKSSLGVTPISCINYVLSLHTPLTLGTATFLFNVVLIFIEFALLRGIGSRRDRLELLLQVPFSLIFGLFIDFNMWLLSDVSASSYLMALCLMMAGCVIQAFGVVLELKPNVVIMSAEGVVKYSARRYGKEFGKLKVAFDITLVSTAAVLSFILSGHIEGLREGTIVGACCTGMVVSLMMRYIFTPARIHSFVSKCVRKDNR